MKRHTRKLPTPSLNVGVDLIAALRLRRSTREYDSARGIPEDVLSTLLWAADGVSGDEDKRTAPSAFGGNQVNLYVATAHAICRYDAPEHALMEVSAADVRAGLCPDEWVGTAPVAVILTGRTDKFPDFVTPAFGIELLQANAGCIAENLHLIAAVMELGTCMVGHMNTDAIRAALALTDNEVPLYVMPVGYLREE